MRLILKLIAAPFALLLTILVVVLVLPGLFPPDEDLGYYDLAGCGLFFISYLVGSVIYLVVAFSYDLPAVELL